MPIRPMVFRGGNCANKDAPLFAAAATAEQAVAACHQCPLIETCAASIGTLAFQLAGHEDAGVIGGEYVRWRVPRPELPYDYSAEPLAADPQQALAQLRHRARYENYSGQLGPRMFREYADRAKAAYGAYDQVGFAAYLGSVYDKAWGIFVKALKQYIPRDWRTCLDHRDVIFPMFDQYLTDIIRLQARNFPLTAVPGLALRYSAQELEDMVARHARHPDLRVDYAKLVLSYDAKHPELAIQDYHLQLALLRRQYAGELPDALLKRICAYNSPASYSDAVAKWRSAYDAVRNDPQYSGYPEWVLISITSASPAKRKQTLYGINRLRTMGMSPLSIDHPLASDSGVTLGHILAAPAAEGPEARWSAREAYETLMPYLRILSPLEQDALILAYGLDIVLDTGPRTEQEVCAGLGVTSLQAYVESVIIPKLQERARTQRAAD